MKKTKTDLIELCKKKKFPYSNKNKQELCDLLEQKDPQVNCLKRHISDVN